MDLSISLISNSYNIPIFENKSKKNFMKKNHKKIFSTQINNINSSGIISNDNFFDKISDFVPNDKNGKKTTLNNFLKKNHKKKFSARVNNIKINKSGTILNTSNDNFFDKITDCDLNRSQIVQKRKYIKSEVFDKKDFLPSKRILNKKKRITEIKNYKERKLNFYKNLKKHNFRYDNSKNKSVDLKLRLPLNSEIKSKIEEKKITLRNKVKSEYKKLEKKKREKKIFRKSRKREENKKRNVSVKSTNLKKYYNNNISKNPHHKKNNFLLLFKNESKEIFKELNLDKKWIEREILNLKRYPNQLKGFIELQSKIIKILSIKYKKEQKNRLNSEIQFMDFIKKFKNNGDSQRLKK